MSSAILSYSPLGVLNVFGNSKFYLHCSVCTPLHIFALLFTLSYLSRESAKIFDTVEYHTIGVGAMGVAVHVTESEFAGSYISSASPNKPCCIIHHPAISSVNKIK
jgi:hypothetical protein